MMTDNPTVKINIDSVDKIASLYDVSFSTAQKIVRYRETYGYFHTPDDLAKVNGISRNLALTLSPHIDWQEPTKEPITYKRNFLYAALTSLLFFIVIRSTAENLIEFYWTLHNFNPVSLFAWTRIGLDLAYLIILLILTLRCSSSMVIQLTNGLSLARKLERVNITLELLLMISFLNYFIVIVFWGHTCCSSDWNYIFARSPSLVITTIVAVLYVIFLSFTIFPLALVTWKPSLASNSLIRKLYDIGSLLLIPFLAYGAWPDQNSPIWQSVVLGLCGIIYMYVGISSIRSGSSLFIQTINAFGLLVDRNNKLNDPSHWMAWINTRLPNPEDQKALRQALNTAYPTSKIRTAIGYIVVTIGGWFTITALTSIIDWLLQGWLNEIFPLFK